MNTEPIFCDFGKSSTIESDSSDYSNLWTPEAGKVSLVLVQPEPQWPHQVGLVDSHVNSCLFIIIRLGALEMC